MDRLYRSEIPEIVQSLTEQMTMEIATEQHNHWAFLAAVTTNGFISLATALSGKRRKPKLVGPENFLGKDLKRVLQKAFRETRRGPSRKDLIADAKAKGLKGPWDKEGKA